MTLIPAAPHIPLTDLPPIRLLINAVRDMLSIWPDQAFEKMAYQRKVFGLNGMVLNDPGGVRHVLQDNAKNYTRQIAFGRIFRPVSGNGLLVVDDGDWRRQRRMLAPIFAPSHLQVLLPHFHLAAQDLLRKLDRSDQANLYTDFVETTLNGVLRALFSLPDHRQREDFAKTILRYFAGPGRPNAFDGFAKSENSFGFALRQRKNFRQSWIAKVDAVVNERKNSPGNTHQDFLDLLLEARDPETGSALNDVEIRDQSATMIVAGSGTSSHLLFWASLLLSLDTAEQTRLRDEISAFPPDQVNTLEDLKNWPRLRLVMLEALRLYPPVPLITRQVNTDDEVAGQHVPAKSIICISPWVIHRHRKFWDNPTAFVPERFANMSSPWTGGNFIPFGAGPRNCIGAIFAMAETQIILAHVLHRFRIHSTEAARVLPVGRLITIPSFEPMFKLEKV